MKDRHSSVDGFIRHNQGTPLGQARPEAPRPVVAASALGSTMPSLAAAQPKSSSSALAAKRRQEISDSLKQIEDSQRGGKRGLFGRRRDGLTKPFTTRKKIKRIAKILLILLIVTVVAVGGFLAFKALTAAGSVFQGNIFDVLQSTPLKKDSNGRTNFLVLGTTDDDPNHDGGTLTDSMMIISVDQEKKDAFMVSIPRDLYVQYGMSCASGRQGKINVYFSCSDDGTDDAAEQNRLLKTQAFIGQIFGVDIQYGIHVNSQVLPKAVDAVGGIDVDIQGSNGAPGILDRNFDGGCNYRCYRVKYDNGVHHLDGAAASFLSMARGDVAPTYGLANSNFDREKNQQKIIIALKNKAMQTGTLTDISKVTALFDAFGQNLRTNIQTKEIQTLTKLVSETDTSKIKTLTLNNTEAPIMTTDNVYGQSVVVPSAGTFDYTGLQTFIRATWSGDASALENATVGVYNGSQTPGIASTTATTLKTAGFTVGTIDDAVADYTPKYTLYDLTGGKKPSTLAKLEKQLGVKVSTGAPADITATDDFVVVVGTGTAAKTGTTSQ